MARSKPEAVWMDLLVDALATYRLTRLATADVISEPVRMAVLRTVGAEPPPGQDDPTAQEVVESLKDPPRLATLVTCRWCAGIWIAAGVTVAPRRSCGGPWPGVWRCPQGPSCWPGWRTAELDSLQNLQLHLTVVVRPARSEGRQRRYSRNDIAIVQHVAQMADEGMTLAGIRRSLVLEAEVASLRRELAQQPRPPRRR